MSRAALRGFRTHRLVLQCKGLLSTYFALGAVLGSQGGDKIAVPKRTHSPGTDGPTVTDTGWG